MVRGFMVCLDLLWERREPLHRRGGVVGSAPQGGADGLPESAPQGVRAQERVEGIGFSRWATLTECRS